MRTAVCESRKKDDGVIAQMTLCYTSSLCCGLYNNENQFNRVWIQDRNSSQKLCSWFTNDKGLVRILFQNELTWGLVNIFFITT